MEFQTAASRWQGFRLTIGPIVDMCLPEGGGVAQQTCNQQQNQNQSHQVGVTGLTWTHSLLQLRYLPVVPAAARRGPVAPATLEHHNQQAQPSLLYWYWY